MTFVEAMFEDPGDAIKLALLYFFTIWHSWGTPKLIVDTKGLMLVEDLDRFKDYQWGFVAYRDCAGFGWGFPQTVQQSLQSI